MKLKEEQDLVKKGIVLSFLFIIGLGYIFYFVCDWTLPTKNCLSDSWFFALKWMIFPVACLWLGVLVLALQRFLTDKIQVEKKREPVSLTINKHFVYQTSHQVLLLFFANLLLATYMPTKNLAIVPTICLIFSVGRVSAFIGEHIHHAYRAFGNFMTYFSTIGPLAYISVRVLVVNFIK